MKAFFKDDTFDFLTRIALGATFHRCADVGEVLATIDGVKDGNGAQWVAAWTATAERLEGEAVARLGAGHRRSAAAAHLRAAKYHETASYGAYLEMGPEKGVARFDELWERYRSAWDAFLDAGPWPSEPVEVPYEGTTLPGYLLRGGDGRRRTLVMNNGSDGSMVDMWVQGALEALERGWNVLLFDGPGQGAALVRQHLFFRADWEAVLTPVVDWLVERPEVDPERIAVLGVSQAGYWVPRALSREHRFAAAVVDPGVVDVSTTLLDHFPHSMAKLLAAGEKEKLDRNMKMGERFSKEIAATVALRFRPYGLDSTFDVLERAEEMRLTAQDVAAITTPLLVTDPEDEQFWPGQPRELLDRLPGTKAGLAFTREEGANFHCEPMAQGLRGERVFDWLDDVVAATDGRG